MTDIVEFLTARLDEDEAAAQAAQTVDPGPWTVEVVEPRREYLGSGQWEMRVDTNWRPGHGAATVVAADTNPLWEPNSYTSAAGEQCMTVPTAHHVARHDPVRVLAEVKAKRERLALYVEVTDILFHGSSADRIKYQRESGRFEALDVEVRRDAAIYADHPDYEQTWALT